MDEFIKLRFSLIGFLSGVLIVILGLIWLIEYVVYLGILIGIIIGGGFGFEVLFKEEGSVKE